MSTKVLFRYYCLVLLSICFLTTLASPDGECVVGEDGSCEDDGCVDDNEQCQEWAGIGECDANPNYMLLTCKKSCDTCNMKPKELRKLAAHKALLNTVGGDETLLETPYGRTQTTDGLDPDKVHEITTNMVQYMENVVGKDPKYDPVRESCKNMKAECIQWKLEGKCSGWYETNCAPVCESCHVLDFKHRCPTDDSVPNVLAPGELHPLFERIVSHDYYQQYAPKILSMPATNISTNTSTSAVDGSIIPDGPWVVLLEKFLTAEECQHLQDLGTKQGYNPSADVGPKDLEGKTTAKFSGGRTSTNAWCTGKCAHEKVVKDVTNRMVNLTGIPQENYEYLQILRYEPGQHYNRHHDFADYHLERQYGPRVLTIFLYLNTVEGGGGGTDFPVLNMTVEPKMGRAVIWPSVLNDFPTKKDERTDHAALPVTNNKGVKFGANAWVHQKDFKEVYARGCI